MAAIRPIQHLLETGEDVAINEPFRAWHYCSGRWHEHTIPELTERRCRGIALLAEAQRRPEKRGAIISVDLPTGHRGEFLLPPATPTGRVVACFRRSDEALADIETVPVRFKTGRWNKWAEREEAGRPGMAELLGLWDAGDIVAFLRKFAEMRLTPVFCGQTGVGKSDIMKTFGSLLPLDFRCVVIEDALEGIFRQRNVARLLFQKNGIPPSDLMTAAMRLRPTVVPVAELRTPEAAEVFVGSTSTGHPGSPTTAHGGTAKQGATRIFNLIKSSDTGKGLDTDTVVNAMADAVHLFLPIENDGGARSLGEAWFAPDAARRGETLHHLLFGH
jgi:type IV secretion system protein VirB11